MYAVVLTGPPGSGKTSVLTALVDALSDDEVPHAAIEVEALRWAHPALSDEQEMRHLRTLCLHYREAGHRLLLISQTVESDGDLARLLDALGAEDHLVVRLQARPATLAQRIIEREPEDWSGLSELVAHSRELAVSMRALRDVDLVLSTDFQRPERVVECIRATRPDELNATQIPPEVASLLGPTPRRLAGYGESAVVAGRGRVAKIGPAAVVAREGRILMQRVGRLPLEVPTPVASGVGWLVMEEVADVAVPWDERQFTQLLVDLAALHDAFEDSDALKGGWLRDPAGAHLHATLAEGYRVGVGIPAKLAAVVDDPAAVAGILARSRPVTLVHGDPTPANVRRPAPGHHVWIDWEWASAASPAVDLACWLIEWPWAFGRRFDRKACVDAYLSARRRPVDRVALDRALDAALVLFFFSNNLPSLARESGHEALRALIAEGSDALDRLELEHGRGD